MTINSSDIQKLVVSRQIAASPATVFQAWTRPEHLVKWWGPAGVTCTNAEIDLRVGGSFTLLNKMPDSTEVTISGTYEEIDPPHLIRHTWTVDELSGPEMSRVTVTFTPCDRGTEVTIAHEEIPTPALRENHKIGWEGCLDKLDNLMTGGGRQLST